MLVNMESHCITVQSLFSEYEQRERLIDPRLCDLLAEGKVIPRSRLDFGVKIGEGHFGVIYEGSLRDRELDEKVAVKTLHPHVAASEQSVNMIIQEALVMKDFDHPHVQTLIGLSFDDYRIPLLVMPFMSKGSLLSYVRDEN